MNSRLILPTFALASLLLSVESVTQAADHLDAPNVMGLADRDINDLYAFQSPTNSNNTVLIMTVNPIAGNPATGSNAPFGATVNYGFQIDNTGDAIADVSYTTTFTASVGGVQTLTTLRNGVPFATGTTGMNITATGAGGGTVRADVFDDPFFFDLNGFNNGLAFTGDDFFAGLNTNAIVLEVPSSDLGGNIGVWATTEVGGNQVDRIGRPAINTVLIPSARKSEFNMADPADDPTAFGSDVQAAIESLNGGDSTHAATLTGILLPDVLTIDTSDASGFLNGRQLADDVIDAELTLLTNSSSPIGDGVAANDVAFPGVFPYLAAANVPEPGTFALGALSLAALGFRRRGRS
ncbi:DUF4331 family protein [Bythopirellula goksoeyrii]|uniref:PEP-CTERM motif protein n=1 Tax=Bythopirellula goksoeyrii TaxID=1400387 RepID=A0A5B9QBU7_9BACT|nr:DUF4331 family protein [Bythopirellula goksoeyrii]QEG34386.1 PEP-CTERM motif protein [Bythopirellula goksoeyrii]